MSLGVCTLILGRDVVAPRTLVLGANRDEDPARPSAPPGVLCESPRVVGGRDLLAGGTWLAIHERGAVVAMLNRRGERPAGELRSRGRLALEVAAAADAGDLAGAALSWARAAVARDRYAPFSLLFASPEACWLMTGKAGAPRRIETVGPGWHVITHADLDDPGEPRTVRLLAALRGFAPRTREQAEAGVVERLRDHGEAGGPPVCIHEGRMVTVSAARVWLAEGEARYAHAEGRPCEVPFADCSNLLAGAASAPEGT